MGMKFRRAAPATLIVSVFVVIVASAAVSNRMFSGMTSSVERSQFDQMEKVLDFNLKGASGKALSRAELIANLPATRRLMAAKDRAGLLAEYQEMFQIQNDKHGVDQAQFILAPTTSFLRLNNPEAPEEDLAPFRPLIVSVDKDRLAKSGVSVSRSGPAVFAVVPVQSETKEHLGMFEVGMDMGRLLDGLKTAYGFELGFFVEEDMLREVATKAPSEVFDEKNRFGRYLRFHSTNADLLDDLVGSDDVDGVEEPFHYVRDGQGATYGVLIIPVRSPSGGPLGLIAVAKDFSETRGAAGRSMVWQALIAVCGIVLLSGMIFVVIRGFLLSPMRAILAGKDLDGDPLCEELQELQAKLAAAKPETPAEAQEEDAS